MKTNEQRIERIVELAENLYGKGEIGCVSLKFNANEKEWIAKLKLTENRKSFSEANENPDEALKALKKRIKRIIKRYEFA